MATRATVAKRTRHIQGFEYAQCKLLEAIDRRKRRKEADENIMEKHQVASAADGARIWRFKE